MRLIFVLKGKISGATEFYSTIQWSWAESSRPFINFKGHFCFEVCGAQS